MKAQKGKVVKKKDDFVYKGPALKDATDEMKFIKQQRSIRDSILNTQKPLMRQIPKKKCGGNIKKKSK